MAADQLEQAHASGKKSRRDVAGYLYGLAAECAVKHMAIPIQLGSETDKNKILYAHFPELRTLLRDALHGRTANALPLLNLILRDAFMNNWHVSMRYADASQIRDDWVDAWREQARAAINTMET